MALRNFLVVLGAFSSLVVVSSIALAQCDPMPEGCTGQGDASLLMRGSRESGDSLKFRLAGSPNQRYKLLRDIGSGPTEVGGIGEVCLEMSADLEVIDSGFLNEFGRVSAYTQLPSDPSLVGSTVAYQAIVNDPAAPNGFAISNAWVIEVCAEGEGDECVIEEGRSAGVVRLGFIYPVLYDGELPAQIVVRSCPSSEPDVTIGEASFLFDPSAPPTLPLVGTNLTVTKLTTHPGVVFIHATICGGDDPGMMLPPMTLVEVSIGDMALACEIDVSCLSPIGMGGKFPPVFITGVEPSEEQGELVPIPTLSEIGLLVLVLALGAVMLVRRSGS